MRNCMTKIDEIIRAIDQEIERLGVDFLTPPQANRILDNINLLPDNKLRPGLPLRNLLREGFLSHAYQVSSKWRIPHSNQNKNIQEKINTDQPIEKAGSFWERNRNLIGLSTLGIAVIVAIIIIRSSLTRDNENNSISATNDTSTPYIISDTTKNGYVKNIYYSNKKISSEGKMINNLRDSTWKYFSEDGVITEQINFKNDKKDGKYVKYYKDGKTINVKGYHSNDKRSGVFEVYFDNGNASAIYTYIDGLKNGKYIKYYEDGKTIKEKGYYSNDELSGIFEEYFDNGFVSARYNYKNGIKDGKFESYDYVVSNKRYYLVTSGYYKNDERDGMWNSYDYYYDLTTNTLGNKLILTVTENYKEDKLNGKRIEYDTQYGFKLIETEYKNGVEDGVRKSYCPHGLNRGKLWIIEQYSNGDLVKKLPYQCNCSYSK